MGFRKDKLLIHAKRLIANVAMLKSESIVSPYTGTTDAQEWREEAAKWLREFAEEQLLDKANETLDNCGREVKTIAPSVIDGKVVHPNLNDDGTWKQ